MSNWLKPPKRVQLMNCLMNGMSVRATAAAVGCSKITVGEYRKLLAYAQSIGEVDDRFPRCECGKDAGHKGWCRHRFQASSSRQEFIKQWKRSDAK